MLNVIHFPSPLNMSTLDPREVQILRAFVLQTTREYLLTHPETTFSWWQKCQFNFYCWQRQRGLPLAYILGHKEFFSRKFIVTKHTLVPRPETEILVEEVLKKVATSANDCAILDVGTGSGCIAITLSLELRQQSMPVFASDFFRRALRVAQKNAHELGASVTFFHSDLLAQIDLKTISNHKNHLIITANLPYITETDYQSEPSIQHEPKQALVAADQGLALYKKLLLQFKKSPTIPSITSFYFEINPEQVAPLEAFVLEQFPQSKITITPDLAGLARVFSFDVHQTK